MLAQVYYKIVRKFHKSQKMQSLNYTGSQNNTEWVISYCLLCGGIFHTTSSKLFHYFFQIDKLFAMTVSFFEKPLEVKKRYPIPIEGMYGWMGMGTEMYVIFLLIFTNVFTQHSILNIRIILILFSSWYLLFLIWLLSYAILLNIYGYYRCASHANISNKCCKTVSITGCHDTGKRLAIYCDIFALYCIAIYCDTYVYSFPYIFSEIQFIFGYSF